MLNIASVNKKLNECNDLIKITFSKNKVEQLISLWNKVSDKVCDSEFIESEKLLIRMLSDRFKVATIILNHLMRVRGFLLNMKSRLDISKVKASQNKINTKSFKLYAGYITKMVLSMQGQQNQASNFLQTIAEKHFIPAYPTLCKATLSDLFNVVEDHKQANAKESADSEDILT